MSQRVAYVLLAGIGIVCVGILVLRGANLTRAANTGPRWRRRLVAAGVGILSAVGIVPAQTGCVACYKPAAVEQNRATDARLEVAAFRAQELHRLLETERVQPTVIQRAAESLDNELDALGEQEAAGQLSTRQRAELKRLRAEAAGLKDKVRERLGNTK